jgi:hypothetical protein
VATFQFRKECSCRGCERHLCQVTHCFLNPSLTNTAALQRRCARDHPIGQIKWKPGNKVETVPAARVKKRLLFEPVHRATPSTRCLPPLLLLLLLLLLPPPAARTHHQIAQILLHVVAICSQSVCCRHMGGARRFRRPQ